MLTSSYGGTVRDKSTIPQITAKRWSEPPQVPPHPRKTTREDYKKFFMREYHRIADYYGKVAGTSKDANQHACAHREGFLYQIEHDEYHARMAMKFLRGSYAYYTEGKGREERVSTVPVIAGQAYKWVRESPSLVPSDHEFLQHYFQLLDEKYERPFEYGSMNRSMAAATSRKMICTLFPNIDGNTEREAYADRVWQDWWEEGDTEENATSYNSIWLSFIPIWLTITKAEHIYQDRRLSDLAERYLQKASPLGFLPAYGDTTGLNSDPGRWISLMEKWATMYHDGRFKWVAHRLFEWSLDRVGAMNQWGNITHTTANELIEAYLAADDSIPEQCPDIGCVVTHRKSVSWNSQEMRQKTGYIGKLNAETIPDKLVLRSGWNAADMYAIVELCPPMTHGHSDTASINLMTASGSVLLADTPYLIKDHSFHNCFVVQDGSPPKWSAERLRVMRTAEPQLKEGRLAAFASIHVDDYMAEPAALDRHIFFMKNKFIWVQDTLTSNGPLKASVGPAWQTVTVYPDRGPNWVNTCMITIPVSSIWEPTFLMQWDNLPWDLLVVFFPPSHANMRIDDVALDTSKHYVNQDLQNNFKYRIWSSQEVNLQAKESIRFNSILAPHQPVEDSGPLARAFQLVLDEPDCTVLRFSDDTRYTVWLGINKSGRTVDIGTIKTDARQFVVLVPSNSETLWWVVDATELQVNDQRLVHGPARVTMEGPAAKEK
jgi:hypothetical protein